MGLFCGKSCQARRDKRLDLKYAYKMQKNDNITDVRLARIDGKTTRHVTAYQMGIDPTASMWQGLSSMTQSVGNAVSSSIGLSSLSSSITNEGRNDSKQKPVQSTSSGGFFDDFKAFVPVVAVLVAFLLNKFFSNK